MKHFWTKKQRAIVKKIQQKYGRNGQIQWRKALREHPEWLSILPKHLPLPRLVKQMCVLSRKRTGGEMAIRALETRLWNLRHRRAYLSQLMVNPKTQTQLRRFKETFGLSYRTVVEEAVTEFYIKTFGKHKSEKGNEGNGGPKSVIMAINPRSMRSNPMKKARTSEPPELSSNARKWIEITINRVLEGNKVNMEFTMFPRRTEPSKIILVDTSGLRTKDEAAFLCKIAVAKASPDEYLFASESYMLAPDNDFEKRYVEAVQRGDMSLKDVPGVEDILMFLYGSETNEFLHVVHLKDTGGRYRVAKREWIASDNESKQAGRFVGFRELQGLHQKGKEN